MGGFGSNAVDLPGADRLEVMHTREQPAIGMHHALSAPDLPPFPQENEQVMGEHGIAIPAAFAALNPEQHAFAVDIPDLEAGHFARAQASSIGNRQDRLVLDAGRGIQHSAHFVPAEHGRQPARMLHPMELAGQVRTIQRSYVEEPQRRHCGVHGRGAEPRLRLLDLVAAQIFIGCRVRGPSKPDREPFDIAKVIALRRPAETMDLHVLDHPLTQRRGRGWHSGIGHVRLLG